MKSTVAVLRTAPDRVLEDTAEVMRLAGVERALSKERTTILKDNISWHFPYLSANTTPWQLEGVVRGLRALGYDHLSSVHNDTVVTDPFKGERLNKLAPIYQRYGVEELYNFRPADVKWVRYEPKAEMLALHRIFPEGIYLPDYFFDKNVVHLPTMKCHIYTTTTGAMKNAFGGLLSTRRHYTHTWIHETLVDPLSIPYIRMAHERGLGCGDVSQIEVVGEDVSGIDMHFHVGSNFASRAGKLLWFGPLKPLQHALFHTPIVNAFILASFVYHDYLWWPLKGKAIQSRLRRDNPWGRLFQGYDE
jgi:hypothetical protein